MIPIPATLSEALSRPHLLYPLASFDVSGQWPVYLAAAWPNEDYSDCTMVIHLRNKNCQEFLKVFFKLVCKKENLFKHSPHGKRAKHQQNDCGPHTPIADLPFVFKFNFGRQSDHLP